MIKPRPILEIETLLKLLKLNIEKIDKRLAKDTAKEAKQLPEFVKKKQRINKKTKYIIFSAATVVAFLVLFYFSLYEFNFSVNIPELKNHFEGESPSEYDFVDF